jgi:hypothetical protein
MRWLDIAGQKVAVDDEIARLAAPRCSLEAFWTEPDDVPRFSVRRVVKLPEGVARVRHPEPGLGEYADEGDTLWASIDSDPYAAEIALRLAFHAVTLRQGGVLIHGAGIAFQDRSVVAVGPSGAGKTTLARLAWAHGGARLMSDEIVALFPDGRVRATPFRSDQSLPIELLSARGVGLMALAKGNEEEIRPLSGPAAVSLLASQAFRFKEREMTQVEHLDRLARIIESMGAFELTFRNHPAVGAHLRDWVASA